MKLLRERVIIVQNASHLAYADVTDGDGIFAYVKKQEFKSRLRPISFQWLRQLEDVDTLFISVTLSIIDTFRQL